MIRFTHVSKSYPRTGTAVDDVSLHIGKGEFVFFTGPSGAGKTTLLKMVYMEERPSSGEVRVSGTSSVTAKDRDVAQIRRKLGIVFQDFRLLDNRTAEQNIAFALEVTGVPRPMIVTRVARVLTQVGELSGGEQQRVAIARALVNDPFVLIADEPTGNLDDRATRGIFQLLRDINAAGTAVMMATHNLDLIRRQEYRTVEMNRGAVVFDSGEDKSGAVREP